MKKLLLLMLAAVCMANTVIDKHSEAYIRQRIDRGGREAEP